MENQRMTSESDIVNNNNDTYNDNTITKLKSDIDNYNNHDKSYKIEYSEEDHYNNEEKDFEKISVTDGNDANIEGVDSDKASTVHEDDHTYYGKLAWPLKHFEEICQTEDDLVKYVSIFYLSHQLFKALRIVGNIEICKEGLIDYIPKSTCNWFLEDCSPLQNLDMFTTILKNLNETCLRTHTVNLYIDYIIELVQLIINTYLHKHSLKDILKLLENTWERVQISSPIIQLRKTLRNTKQASRFIDLAKHLMKRHLSENVDPRVLLVYKYKYLHQYDEACFDQTILRYQIAEDKLTKQINEWKKMYIEEEYCGDQILHFYNENLENIGQRYNYLKSIYEDQETTLIHENEYLKRQINELQSRQKFYEEELERYNYEIYCVQNNIKISRRAELEIQHASSTIRFSNLNEFVR